jgi:hypothetical protein
VNLDDLPEEIVQPLLQLGRALMAHVRAHRDTSLAEHEDGVLGAWRVVAPVLLEGVLQVATTGLEDSARVRSRHGVLAVNSGGRCSRGVGGTCRRGWVRSD